MIAFISKEIAISVLKKIVIMTVADRAYTYGKRKFKEKYGRDRNKETEERKDG